jgi:hypothetical protein
VRINDRGKNRYQIVYDTKYQYSSIFYIKNILHEEKGIVWLMGGKTGGGVTDCLRGLFPSLRIGWRILDWTMLANAPSRGHQIFLVNRSINTNSAVASVALAAYDRRCCVFMVHYESGQCTVG